MYTFATSMEAIKIWKKKGSNSEGSEITTVVSSVADNLERVFLALAYTRQGVTENVSDIQ